MMSVSRWHVAAASVRGTSHEQNRRPCQDAHYWRVLPDDGLVVAVADGAGSAPLGQIGAAIAASTAATTLCARLSESPWPREYAGWEACFIMATEAAQAAVDAEATARQVARRQLATTLILAAATADQVAVIQIGDGAVVVGDSEGNVISLTTPLSGEYANETTFLIAPEALNTAQVRVWPGKLTSLAAFTVGLQRLALTMPSGAPYAPFFTPLFRFVAAEANAQKAHAQITAFLRSERVTDRTDDDLTLVVATAID
jgi:serine/threonine protein phosphatase PrpC